MIFIYRFLTFFFYPILIVLIYFRKLLNKEDHYRYKEKIFSSNFFPEKDNKKKLIWFHAASIGETQSIFPLIQKLNTEIEDVEFLITTTTLSSAHLIKKELFNEKNIIHRFFPIDKPSLIKKFLNNWSPTLTIFVDSEIWPNFILEIKKKKIPLVLLNARITKKTFLRWNLIPNIAEKIFQSFDLCLSSSNESKKYLEEVKVKNVKYFGNLKLTSESQLNNLNIKNKEILDNKKFWCAVSTHEEEDIFCLKTHLNIKKIHKDIITIIIPRHIDRAQSIKSSCKKLSLKSQILVMNTILCLHGAR